MPMHKQTFIHQLRDIVGKRHVLSDPRKTAFYRTGFRSGKGAALAVVFPGTLLQQWLLLKLCIANNKIVIMQAANTGLTEGSTPSGHEYDREIVIISTLRINNILLINEGKQIVSFSGATLHTLEKVLAPLDRSPHSVIGSSCLGASIVGGVANNSGGSLVKRGPAYTELALFAQVNTAGELELINHLGIELGDCPETIFKNLENQEFSTDDLPPTHKAASDKDYTERLRNLNADTPARFNADTGRLYEASGCGGKLAVFAVRLDTFPRPKQEQLFYIGTNDPNQLTRLRNDILTRFTHLPEVAEYMHRDCFNIAEAYGKDTFLLVKLLGTDFMPKLFAIKGRVDALLIKIKWLSNHLTDRLLQNMALCFPQHLPKRLLEYRTRYEHHLLLKMSDEGIAEAQDYLSQNLGKNNYLVCTADEQQKAFLHRFVAAGAAVRYQQMHSNTVGGEVMALDIALKRNDKNWVEHLPMDIAEKIDLRLYYGHFLCYVFHQDYILKKGVEVKEVKAAILKLLEQRGAKYPAEHNVGHMYKAEEGLADFYRNLDPTNTFNPGIGQSSRSKVCV